jgi:hypothetical protein
MKLSVAELLSSCTMKQSLVTVEFKAAAVGYRCDTMTDNMRHELPSNTIYKRSFHDTAEVWIVSGASWNSCGTEVQLKLNLSY